MWPLQHLRKLSNLYWVMRLIIIPFRSTYCSIICPAFCEISGHRLGRVLILHTIDCAELFYIKRLSTFFILRVIVILNYLMILVLWIIRIVLRLSLCCVKTMHHFTYGLFGKVSTIEFGQITIEKRICIFNILIQHSAVLIFVYRWRASVNTIIDYIWDMMHWRQFFPIFKWGRGIFGITRHHICLKSTCHLTKTVREFNWISVIFNAVFFLKLFLLVFVCFLYFRIWV